ncbi:DNA-binding LytR/AlgR family response regulator [Actinoalloteichus hymeniacidonis]|uniref:Two component transcriptional regulator, LytTR family n=1 Tax=Actinoalloteichus hymeniacidonis TaxID=340345 RepID=A0AAC9MV76_9PSEU|nr:LytTR family DNA-binding domain-containing protein [Actinoalloteichus hymeniacidonis]AOS60928.1 two component transcriptional regulator, LytTR family [Actinoalloteichus hymeniacidonis]MBB5911072.1 DNA-binding LytR/AlgR family response regulator [Actinoalloteichus hymeniacidonis]
MNTQENGAGLIVLAVDDEDRGLDELLYCLRRNGRVRRILTAFDSADALRVLRSNDAELRERSRAGLSPVDVVFLDIAMPGLDGMELGKVLTAFRVPPALIFVTGFDNQSLEAFNVGATDYLVKPPTADRVDEALRRAERLRKPESGMATITPVEDEVIPVELAGTTKLIPRSSIRYVEAQGDYARLHTVEGSHLVRIPLSQLEERWSEVGFARIHRSYLVSLALVSELQMSSSGYSVRLGTGETAIELPVSRRHTRELKDRLVRPPKRGLGPGR